MKRKIALYTDCLPPLVDVDGVAKFLSGFGFAAQNEGELFGELSAKKTGEKNLRDAASFLAGIRIRDFETPLESRSVPSPAEVDEEVSIIAENKARPSAAYDGFWFQRWLRPYLAALPRRGLFADLILTGRLLCTCENARCHARAVIMEAAPGSPQIVSSAGAAEGPAKPPEYYWAKGRMFQQGLAADEGEAQKILDEVFEGRFIKPYDPQMGRIVSAYSLQPLFYILTGSSFCDNPLCCLFNSHRQSEVLEAQSRAEVCERCQKKIR